MKAKHLCAVKLLREGGKSGGQGLPAGPEGEEDRSRGRAAAGMCPHVSFGYQLPYSFSM